MESTQLELFQTPSSYELGIFEKAKQLKGLVQQIFSNSKVEQDITNFNEKYAVLKVNVDIDQIRDQDSIDEPSTPKMFIWQFIPSISIDDNVLLKPRSTLHGIEPKIIPKFINEIFTADSFTHRDFLKYTTQYFTLEILTQIFENEIIQREIEPFIENKKLIIYINSKLFIHSKVDSDSLLERDIINKIKNFYFKLKSLQKTELYFIGSYDDFTSDNDLLEELDANEFIKSETSKQLGKDGSVNKLKWIYQNDYLFLNNYEFYFQGKHNTDTWDNNLLISPKILNSQLKEIDETKITAKTNNFREVYAYIRKAPSEAFFRVDILFPNLVLTKNLTEEIILISQKLKDV